MVSHKGGDTMAADGSVVIQITGDDKEFKASLHSLGDVATSALKGVTAAVAGASTAIAGLAAAAAKVGSEFEASLAATSTMFGDVEVDTEGLTAQILELSNASGVAATQISDSLYNALSAGIPVTEDMTGAMDFMERSTKLAAAGFTDVDTAVTATAKVMNAYGMTVDDVDQIQKVMLQTQNKGITTVNELGSTLAQVTPTAAAMGVSFENVGAALATMTAQGTPTAQATTQLNSLIAELGKNGTAAAKNLAAATEGTEYAGKSFKELMDAGVPLNEVLDLMAGYADENGLSMIDMFSSIEAGKAALSMAGENSAAFADNLSAMSTEADVVGDAYAKVTDTLDHKIGVLKESVANLGIAVYEGMSEPLKEAAGMATDWIGQITDAFTEGGLEGAVGALGNVLAEAVTYIANLAPKMIDAGIRLLQALLTGIQQNLPALAQGAVGIVTSLINGIIALLPQLAMTSVSLVAEIVKGLLDSIPTLIDSGLQLIEGLAEGILQALPSLTTTVPEIAETILRTLTEQLPRILEKGTEILRSLITGIVGAIPQLIVTITQLIPQIVMTLAGLLPEIVEAGIEILSALISGIVTAIPQLVAAIPQIIIAIVGALITAIPQIVEAGIKLILALPAAFIQSIPQIIQAVPQIIDGLKTAFLNYLEEFKTIGKNLITGLWEGISGMGGWIIDQVKGFFGGVVDGVKNFLGIHSPSRVFAEIGGYTMEGFAIGMENAEGKVIKTAGELSEAILDAATDWVEDKKYYNKLAAKDELSFWQELRSMAGLQAKELAKIDKSIYAAKVNASKESFEASKSWIEREKFYNRLSAEEEIAAWERVVQRKNLLTEQQIEAEKNLYSAQQQLLKEQKASVQEYERELEARAESLRSFAGLFDKVTSDSKVTGWELLKNLREQVALFQGWQKDMETLTSRGVTGPLLKELQDLGPRAAAEIKALTALSEKELKEYVELFEKKGKLASDEAEKELSSAAIELPVSVAVLSNEQALTAVGNSVAAISTAVAANTERLKETASSIAGVMCETILSKHADFYSVGVDAMRGLDEGLAAQGRSAVATARRIADSIIWEMQRALDIHSPSRKMRDLVGIPTAQGFMVGFEEEMEGLSRRMQSAIDAETMKLSVQAATQAENKAASSGVTREVYKSTNTVEKVTHIEGDGVTGELVRMLGLRIKAEDNRVGDSLVD